MEKLTILFLAFVTLSCNNQSDKNTAQDNTDTASQVEQVKVENIMSNDTATNSKQDFTYKPTDKTKPIQQVDNLLVFNNFYEQFGKPSQSFTLKVGEDKTITCKEGTKITIKSNSFITVSDKPVKGNVDLYLKEYYKVSDILLAGLTTTSNDEILETGGMLYIEALSDGEKCKLKEGATIDISFPTKYKKRNMKLFSGNWTSDHINWTLQQTKDIEPEESTVFSVVETMPEFPGGREKLMGFISNNVKYPRTAISRRIQGTVYIGFIVNETGGVENIRVLRGVDPSLDQAAIAAIRKMPKWIPGTQRGKNVKVNMTVPVRFSVGDNKFSTDDDEYAMEFEKQVTDDSLSSTEMSEISRYLFSTSKLGWINCDRFYEDDSPKTNYFVNIGNSKQVDIKIVFNNINSILRGSIKDNKCTFDNVPVGNNVTLVALKYENGQYYLAIKETKITLEGEPMLEFQPVTMAGLKTEMKKLNKI